MNTVGMAKAEQACRILNELDLDCWLIWVRETESPSNYRPSLHLHRALSQLF